MTFYAPTIITHVTVIWIKLLQGNGKPIYNKWSRNKSYMRIIRYVYVWSGPFMFFVAKFIWGVVSILLKAKIEFFSAKLSPFEVYSWRNFRRKNNNQCQLSSLPPGENWFFPCNQSFFLFFDIKKNRNQIIVSVL